MRNWRTMVGALCIVLAMMLGAFAGFVYARPGGVGAPSETGTRGEDRRLLSASDEAQEALDADEAELLAEGDGRSAFASDSVELVSADETVAQSVTPDEARQAVQNGVQVYESSEGTVTVDRTAGTRGAWPPGTVDAGGPYGGPNTFEGDPPITFTVTAYDPAIIFFRWDFNNDGKYDFPDQTGGGSIGKWTTLTSVQRQYNDNYYGDVKVEGWDGISTIIQFNAGDNLGQGTSPYWYVYPRNSGWKFTPKSDLLVTELGMFQWYSMSGRAFSIRIWDTVTRLTLASCAPAFLTYQWVWCTLAAPITVVAGREYIIAEHKNIDYYPYFMGFLGPTGGSPPYSPPNPAKVTVGNFFYTWTTSNAYPATDGGNTVIMMIDFRWQETLIIPDTASDTALLDVNNVAPIVGGVTTNPNPGLEGSPTEFVAEFTDPGIDDTWEFRWTFHDGEVSPWLPVSKFSGGADVLFLHTFAADVNALRTGVAGKCGSFCMKIDALDFGPTGENRVPDVDELLPYDVVVMGLNYFHYQGDAIGDLLADYMDAGGNVVMMQGAFDTSYGTQIGIAGRWESDDYSPIARGPILGGSASLGTIYVPGHPLLDGVGSVSATGLRASTYGATPGGVLVADWTGGVALAATKENPVVPNGARAVALNFFPILGYTGGDYYQMIANAIRWSSRQPDPVILPMPIQLDAYEKTYRDDEPTTTTPQDSFPVSVEVRDDDHGKIEIQSKTQLYFQDFQVVSQCSGYYYTVTTWPPGWSSNPNPYGWVCGANSYGQGRSPYILYYFNDFDTSNVYTPTFDFSAYSAVQLEYYTYWAGDYAGGTSDGYIEATTDGGATWPHLLKAYHHNNPGRLQGNENVESSLVGGASSVQIRFRYVSADDWWWAFDNVRITGIVGEVINGLGAGSGVATIANVPPTAAGGFDSAYRTEAQSLLFEGFEITDPAILEPTEWFAYAWDFDDGTAVDWVYVGSMAPPRFDVLIVHTACLGLIGATCDAGGSGQLTRLVNMLNSLDDVGTVDTWNFINYPAMPTAPPLSTMLQYDVIIVATNWAYYSYAPFDLARRQVGDRLADYVDSGRGGVITMMCVYCTSGGSDIFSIRGRYMDEDYGPHERANYLFGAPTTIEILVPEHEFFVKVGPSVGSSYIYDALLPLTPGGTLLAKFNTGTTAVSDKVHANGARIGHFGGWHAPPGADAPMLLRNMIGWVAGGIPSPKIPAFSHTYGDNGIYTVDFTAIDDDMGFVWDFGANMPMEVIPGVQLSHRFMEVAVDNVDPLVTGGIEAFIAAETCVRVSGTVGNTVTLTMYVDGAMSTTVSTTRMNGDPNPPTEKCGLLRVDVLAAHTYRAELTYSQPMGGSNPTWLIFSPWREPVTPGHGTISIKYDFDAAGTVSTPMPTLKRDLLAEGDGAKIDFVAEASDVGTDDLAFMWVWGAEVIPKGGGLPEGTVYDIHVWHNDGSARTDGVLDTPHYLGFSEPYFDRTANDDRSPMGTVDFRVRDTAVHAFDLRQDFYYVALIVLDDDNTRGYPSDFLNDGIDMEFILLDLR